MDRPDDSADEIRRAMRRTRVRATSEINEVVAGAREFTDWRSYPRRYPWATLAAAAVAGYVIVPNREKLIEANPQSLKEFARQHDHKLYVSPRGARPPERGLLGALVVTLGTAAFKLGLSAAGRELSRRFQGRREALSEEFAP